MASSEFYADLQPATERIGLTERLDEERRAIVAQVRDLSAAEIHARPLAATDLSVGRIAKHLAFAEDRWFQHKLLGLDLGEPWRSVDPAEQHDWSFRSADLDTPAAIIDLYENACRRSRDATDACPSMETAGPPAVVRQQAGQPTVAARSHDRRDLTPFGTHRPAS